MKILVTPRSFGKNNPELFDILRDAGLEIIRNDSGGILSEAAVKEKLAPCEGVILGVDPMNAAVLAAQILAVSDADLAAKLDAARASMSAQIAAKDAKLQAELG